jgi:hypothetical protein
LDPERIAAIGPGGATASEQSLFASFSSEKERLAFLV